MTPWRRGLAALAWLALPALASGCFYDSRWLQQKQAQQGAVKAARPAELKPTTGETELGAEHASRALRVRAYASPRYAAEVVDWPAQLATTLAAAGDVMRPTLGARFELTETTAWATHGPDDDLAARLDELASADDAKDVDLVVGLVGSVPRAEASFHQLGLGRILGKHVVVRAMNDAREMEALDSFERVAEAERRDVYRARKRHKTTAVFLHEVGHTLGLPHELDPKSLMHGRYDPKETGFSEEAVSLMRLTLAHRAEGSTETEAAFGASFSAALEKGASVWVAEDRGALLARWRPAAPPQAPASSAPKRAPKTLGVVTPGEVAADPLAGVVITDRHTYERAMAEKQAGHLAEARELAKPLFASYPDSPGIQDLRCQLAMAGGGAFEAIQLECARSLALSGAGGGARP